METAAIRCIDTSANTQSPSWRTWISCRLWGHRVDNSVFRRGTVNERLCRCGTRYLFEDGSLTRVRHTLSCFLRHHTYEPLGERDGHHEYVCIRCGHPLLFPSDADPYASHARFPKKVRYLCGLLGHRVHTVTVRNGAVEYACGCGHSFLKRGKGLGRVRHPLACVARGHLIRFVERRARFAEYVCRTCGHPFCFADPEKR